MIYSGLRKLIIAFLMFGTVWVLALAAFGFLLWSLHLYLSTLMSPSFSALTVGVITLVIAFLLALITKSVLSPDRDKKGEKSASEGLAEIINLVKEYPRLAVLCSVVAGLLIGTSSKIRGSFGELVRTLLRAKGASAIIEKFL